MVAAIRQLVTVQPGGVIRVRSAELRAGAQAEVIVLMPDPDQAKSRRSSKSNGTRGRKSASREVPVARMTQQVRGDIAWAKRVRNDIEQGREKLISWEQIKAERGR